MTRDPYISLPRGDTTADTILIKLGRVGESRDAITLAQFRIKRFITVTVVSG